jgi:rubredoxin
MASWRCSRCGYAIETAVPPDECPSCKQKCEFVDSTCYTPECAEKGVDDRIGSGGTKVND